MDVTVVVGGVGGARFLQGVLAAVGAGDRVRAVVNVGDDIWMHGLRVCPDLDTCMYTLGGGIDADRGWGRAAETWSVGAELAAYGADPSWFSLGDRDIATHLVRTRMLRAGYPLSAVTAALCARWRPGVELVPASDDRIETHVVVDDPADDTRKAIHFQEWWVRHRAALPARGFASVGRDQASACPDALAAVAEADVLLLAPSNPVVSVGTVVDVPGLRAALASARAPVVGVSPIVDGQAVRGMAEACLTAIDVPSTAEGVGRHYGSRATGGLLDGWLVAPGDAGADVPGVTVRAVPLMMTDPDATAAMVRAAFEVAGV